MIGHQAATTDETNVVSPNFVLKSNGSRAKPLLALQLKNLLKSITYTHETIDSLNNYQLFNAQIPHFDDRTNSL